MSEEVTFRVMLSILAVIIVLIRVFYVRKLPKETAKKDTFQKMVLGASWFWTASMGLYSFGFIAGAHVPLPVWLRLAGVVGMVIAIPLSFWVYIELGKNFYVDLRISEGHSLVTTGPYRLVRHPMYAVFIFTIMSSMLLSSHVLVLVSGALLITIVVLRIKREDPMLEKHFGERYTSYMRSTGALFPRLRS